MKYEPEIPTEFDGKLQKLPNQKHYDIENIKNFPDAFKDYDSVIVTEKIHGTMVRITFRDGKFYVSSKGLGDKGFAFTEDTNNLYMRMFRKHEKDLRKVADSPHIMSVTLPYSVRYTAREFKTCNTTARTRSL